MRGEYKYGVSSDELKESMRTKQFSEFANGFERFVGRVLSEKDLAFLWKVFCYLKERADKEMRLSKLDELRAQIEALADRVSKLEREAAPHD